PVRVPPRRVRVRGAGPPDRGHYLRQPADRPMSLKLTVYAPVDPEDPEGDLQDYVYDGVTLLKQFPTFVSEYEQGKVVQPNAQLRVKEGLFGVDSWFDLPEGDWRAKVEYGTAVLINGR